jgi:predicted kinase
MDHPLREPLGNLQWRLAQELLSKGQSVIMESGHWMREERDEKRLAARAIGVPVELQYLSVPLDELHRRVAQRTTERTWGSYPLTPEELDKWIAFFEPPDASELALFDTPTVLEV